MQRTTAHNSHRRCAALALASALLGGACDEPRTASTPAEQLPTVELAARDAQHLELRVSGPEGLRGLQATLVYDPAALQIDEVRAGADATRIDRVFAADPAQANGRLVIGLTDTRRVPLPARGTLVELVVSAAADARSTVRLERIVAVRADGEALSLQAAPLELGAP